MREAVNHFPGKLKKQKKKKEWMKERHSSKAAPDIRCATIREGCNAQTA